MFNVFKSGWSGIVSPVTGKCILVGECEDPVFKDKVLGDGVALLPSENTICAPCNGTVVQIAHTFHAICFETDDGLEILLHLGIDTVKLKGEGFVCHVTVGQKVKAGERIIEMDIALLQSRGFSIQSPCIITNQDKLKKMKLHTGDVKCGESEIIQYAL